MNASPAGSASKNVPEFFRESEDDGFAFVHRQPVTPDEIERAEEALDECPVTAIGNDG